MKLTRSDFYLNRGNTSEIFPSLDIVKQILENQEKAEKWDEFINSRKGTASESFYKQENKQLKEYKKEIERLAENDLLWKKVIEMDKLEHIKKRIDE